MKVVLEYSVGAAQVQIVKDSEEYKYIVIEPPLPEEGARVLFLLRDYFLRHPEKDPLRAEDRWVAAEVLRVTEEYERHRFSIDYYLIRDAVGYGKVDVPLRDPEVEEVAVTPGGVFVVHRRLADAEWVPTNIRVRGEGEARSIALRLAQRAGRGLSPAFPIVEARLPEGHRLVVKLGVDSGGVAGYTGVTVRKFPEEPYTLGDLARMGTLSPRLAALLKLVVEARGMILVTGPMGSGKTTLVNALLMEAPRDRRIVTVEEVPELKVDHPLWTPLYVREPLTLDPTARAARVGLRRLLKTALRLRADYVAVAEARGREVRLLFEAAALGSGSLATFHAGGLSELERRLLLLGVTEDLLDLVWVVVVMAKTREGRRVREAYARLDGAWHPLARLRGDAVEALPEGEEALKARIARALAAAPHQLEDALREAEQTLAAQQPG